MALLGKDRGWEALCPCVRLGNQGRGLLCVCRVSGEGRKGCREER